MYEIQQVLSEALEKGREKIPGGAVATYIPELGKADKNHLGVCLFDLENGVIGAGDCEERFTIQSISKVISLCAGLEACGFQSIFDKVGMEPSGAAFNSLVELDLTSSYPYNPMINSGAIAVISRLMKVMSFEQMLDFARKLCMDPLIEVNEKVYWSEMNHLSRNRAIAYLLESKGILEADVEKTLDFYVKMCSLDVTAKSLAGLGAVLACGGIHPETGERLLGSDTVRVVKTVMLTCGMYDGSGEFAVHVGIPSKSGVGGGILAVVDKKMGIGIFGPALDEKGNSIGGNCVLRFLSERLKLHMFA